MTDELDDEILQREEARKKKEEARRDRVDALRSDNKQTDDRRFRFREQRTLNNGNPARWEAPKRPKTLRCLECEKKIKVSPLGRLRDYCSRSCQQRAYERRKHQRPALVERLARDIATVQVQDMLRKIAWDLLKQAGLVSDPSPPPAPKRKGPSLRIVNPDGPQQPAAPIVPPRRRPPWD